MLGFGMTLNYNDDPFANPGEPKRGQCVLYRNVWFKPEDFPLEETKEELRAFGVNQKALERICSRMRTKSLFIKGMTATDLSPLADAQQLEELAIYWANKFTDASPIAKLKNLKTLVINHTMRWHDLSQLAGTNIVQLDVSGGMGKGTTYETLEPLSTLKCLERLVLTNCKVEAGGLKPLKLCRSLKELVLDCRFPTEEYAYLSVHMSGVTCEAFAPFIKIEGNLIGDKDVMVVGFRKPFLNAKKDAKKLDKFVRDFEGLQDKFSK
jgi:hypothetical protein